MTLAQLERELRVVLAALEEPAYETRRLLMAATGLSASDLLLKSDQEVEDEIAQRLRVWAKRRRAGYPLAYLSGRKGFYKAEFLVTREVLIPRPESEHVIEVARARARAPVLRIADLGCGSGCLGLSLLGEWRQTHLLAIDSSLAATELTMRNAVALNLRERLTLHTGTVESAQASGLDVIVANPPYIAEGDPAVQLSVHQYEPHSALYSGADGLEAIRSWTQWAQKSSRAGGLFVCEIGTGQSERVRDIMKRFGFEDVSVQKDLAGHDRVVSAYARGE